jgi:hypothetical protein
MFQDFNERAKEVSQYFMLLKTLEQETTKLVMVSQSGTQKIKPMNSELIKTLKASGFLLSSWLQLNIKRGMGILPVHRLEACSTI